MERKILNFADFTDKNTEETLRLLESSTNGLTEQQANERLLKFGFNELPSKKRTWFHILFSQLKSPFTYLLFIAGTISLIIGEIIDSLFIFLFVVINVVLGFIQEYRAEKAIEVLKSFLPNEVKAIRNSERIIINKKYLVPGDVVILSAGDIAPADLRIIEAKNLIIDESILTGESKAVEKDENPLPYSTKEIFEAKNIIFSGTSIINGEARGIVINNIRESSVGKISKLVEEIRKKSFYEKELLGFSKLIIKMVLFFIAAVFILRLFINRENLFDYLIFCIALIVSILPEALPTVVVFSLSQGALKLAKRKVVVKRLNAIEDLGNIKILCSDKTGTLTENKMRLDEIFASDIDKTTLFSLLSTELLKKQKNIENAFDKAIVEKYADNFVSQLNEFKLIAENPFDLKRLINSVIVEGKDGRRFLITKGAPEKIFEKTIKIENKQSSENKFDLTIFERKIKEVGEEGKRVLAVAYREIKEDEFLKNINEWENNFNLLGLLIFADPLKKTAKQAITKAERLGVRVKLITGDSREVAGYVGYKIGLIPDKNEVITGKELEKLSPEEFDKTCEKIDVFARISPEMKYKIIESLQKKYEVGFLGEGINDAPALKIANVAIAVNTAADISREIADIILLENDLNVIIEGISYGRKIFNNLDKYIKTTLASNFGNFYSIAIISLFIPFLPMLPIQILVVNLLSDFPMIAIATDNVEVKELKRPKSYQMQKTLPLIIKLAIVSTIFDFIFFTIFYRMGEKNLQTLWFIESILTELVLIFAVRTTQKFYQTIKPSYPLIFLGLIATSVTIFLPFTSFGVNILHFQKVPIQFVIIVILLVAIYFIISEGVKLKYYKKHQLELNHQK